MVTLATGRNYHSAKNYADRLRLDVPLICANGALVRHRNGQIISEENLNNNTIASLLAEMQEAGLYIQVYHKGGIFSSGKTGLSSWLEMICANKAKINQLGYSIREYCISKVKRAPDLAAVIAQQGITCHKIFSAGKDKTLSTFQKRAVDLGLSADYYPATKGLMYLEITSPGINKGWALKKLAGHLEVKMAEVVAIGDNLNDSTMIQEAGLGVVMGNGHGDLKKMADRITLSNDEDGVAVAIADIVMTGTATRPAV